MTAPNWIYIVVIVILVIIYQLVKRFMYKKKVTRIELIGEKAIEFNEKYMYSSSYIRELKNQDYNIPGSGHGFTLEFEMQIEDVPSSKWESSYDKLKPILKFSYSPNIYYHPKNNYLDIVFNYQDNSYFENYKHIKIYDIPLQRWNHIVIKCDNRNISVYLNEEIVDMVKLPNVPKLEKRQIQLGEKKNNFLGKIKNLRYYDQPIDIPVK